MTPAAQYQPGVDDNLTLYDAQAAYYRSDSPEITLPATTVRTLIYLATDGLSAKDQHETELAELEAEHSNEMVDSDRRIEELEELVNTLESDIQAALVAIAEMEQSEQLEEIKAYLEAA